MTPASHVRINPDHIRKDSNSKCEMIRGSGPKSWPTDFDKRFAANREQSEQLQAKMAVPPLGSSQLLVDG